MSLPGPFQIGSAPADWPGLAKLMEECGELTQVLGKLIATGGDPDHWDGTVLDARLADELGDVLAAADFFAEVNAARVSGTVVRLRREDKLALFRRWHQEGVG